jgi:hypothetical protein
MDRVRHIRLVAISRCLKDAELVRLLDAEGLTADPIVGLLVDRLHSSHGDGDFFEIEALKQRVKELEEEVATKDCEIEALEQRVEDLEETQEVDARNIVKADATAPTHPGPSGEHPQWVKMQLSKRGPLSQSDLDHLAHAEVRDVKAMRQAVRRMVKRGDIDTKKDGRFTIKIRRASVRFS